MKKIKKVLMLFLFLPIVSLDVFAGAIRDTEVPRPFGSIRAQSMAEPDTELLKSCLSGHLEDVTRYLEAGASPDSKTDRGLTALMCAVIGQNLSIVSMLCNRAANIHRRDINGENALQWALNVENRLIESYLRSRGGEIAQISLVAAVDEPLILKASSGNAIDTDFLNACMCNNRLQIENCLASGADINAVDTQSDAAGNARLNAIMIAVSHKSSKFVRFLCEKSAVVDFDYAGGNTPLIFAAHKGYLNIVSVFCEYHAQVNHANTLGRTALMEAVGQAHGHVVDFLCTHGRAKMDAADLEGTTALMMAAAQNDAAMVSMLCRHGARLDLVNCAGQTVWDIARENLSGEAIRELIGAQVMRDFAREIKKSVLYAVAA